MLQWATRPLTIDGTIAERQAEFVKGVELQGKSGFDLARRRGQSP